MHVSSLSLVNFRSYEQVDLALTPGVTTLLGANGQGKTNVVEAIGYIATQSSHRVAGDAPLVRQGEQQALIRAEVVRDGRPTLVELELTPGRGTRARINRGAVPRARDALGLLTCVLFAPEDLAIVKGDPGERRRFMDELLVQMSPRMAGVRSDVDRVLKQRNSLLKSASVARRSVSAVDETLSVWDEHFATAAADLIAARVALITQLMPFGRAAYDRVSDDGGPLDASYQASWGEPSTDRAQVRETLLVALRERRRDEIDRGITLVGPQRDDLAVSIRDLPVRGYASHGESWSAALALRLASYDLLSSVSAPGDDPVLLLDDVFAELDSRRRERLAELVAPATQVIITAAVAADVPEALTGRRLAVTRGAVTDEGERT